MTGMAWLGVSAWIWFALLAIAGQRWPLAGTMSGTSVRQSIEPRRIVTNISLSVGNMLVELVLPATAILAAIVGGAGDFGLLHHLVLPIWARFALAMVLSDLLFWVFHVLAHSWPAYWRIHRVHHCDAALDVLTSYRQHPLAVVMAALLQVAGIAMLGLDPAGVAAYNLLLAFHTPLAHANLAWPLPFWLCRAIGWLFLRPSQHGLHHSADSAETNSNYGEVLSVWDRLAGTLCDADADHLRHVRIGLGPPFDTLDQQLGSG